MRLRPDGAVVAAEHVAAALIEAGIPVRHATTFGGHPLSAAIALKNIEIFERDQVLGSVRELTPHLRGRLHELLELPIVGDVRGDGFLWAVELVKDTESIRFSQTERDELIRNFLPRRLRETGLLARPDDREDSVVHLCPPLICDRAVLDEIVDTLADVLTDAAARMGVR